MLVDAHTHLDHYDEETLAVVLGETERLGVRTIAVAVDVPSYVRTLAIAERSPLITSTFGIHPWRAADWVDRLDELDPYLAQTPMIGEIGLDFHWIEDERTYPAQRQVFEFFLAAARDQDKPVNLHTKGAEAEIAALLARYEIRRAIVHWYSGPHEPFQAMLALGCYFTVGVEVLTSEAIVELAQRIPLDRLLTETDGPGGLEWLTGETGMPHHIDVVVDKLAAIRNIDRNRIEEAIASNLHALFAA